MQWRKLESTVEVSLLKRPIVVEKISCCHQWLGLYKMLAAVVVDVAADLRNWYQKWAAYDLVEIGLMLG